ncbi:hypothetical protein TREMEDRAFT_71620 [Tremella mesenterica DSM 1558]|uniref:uncharacterized protein n=1 Tax=Tremella mesenterica (strain ATCC 24925 / CBS 8224 / DSM 1558 / NBRC 9311 / NRRL Y-6157 / RJB 2259-6 / UBC 559-6) TaxID=578456 RepID=UPI0003F4A617|nr:uncharacterized protein TREMEDRAFT_71620 [Tremella mesenterica DSM 1558]EIW69431.1 hypothetical protein TREMEDRAFT_71620 [Tremella mesenterica DSM 1558]
MPRIPVRTTPYHTLPRCTRHYKSKRDLILRALGKASFINGSQFVIAWISPKGEVDVYASELLQASVSSKEGGVLNRKELDREAGRVKGEMSKRWEEIRRLEEKGEVPTFEEDAEEAEDVEEENEDDPDRTMVDEEAAQAKKQSPAQMMSSFPAARASTPQPSMHTITLQPHAVEDYYNTRFNALQQATCKLVVKAWIKVIEPKKQMKFPYNKGEEYRPAWWPEGVKHREPDHLSKQERLVLLSSIIRSPLISVARLELSTAEAAAFISRPRLSILREVYLVAKEEEKRRKEGDSTSELVVHLPHTPVSPSAISPEPEKRTHSTMEFEEDKENVSSYNAHAAKRVKHSRLPALTISTTQANYDYAHPFTFAPQSHLWPGRDGAVSAPPPHLSPYPQSEVFGDYRPHTSIIQTAEERYHPNHLAPILNPHQHTTTSPVDAHQQPFSHPAGMQYYPRTQPGQGYLHQHQIDYLQQQGQGGYDYGSPYIADNWENSFGQGT